MRIATRRIWIAVGLVALLQSAVLAWMVAGRIALLKRGQEIVLEVVPVDPRSLFRGDYVILSYSFSQVPSSFLPPDARLRPGQPVYVAIERRDGTWTPVAAALDRASLGDKPGRPVLKGRTERRWLDIPARRTHIALHFGIESYFVPEGKGRELERIVGERKLAAIVALDGSGTAAIKGLEVEGKRIYDEPLL